MPRKKSNDTKKTRIRVAGKSNIKKTEEQKKDKFCFDEEIVIGLKRIDEPIVEKKNKRRKSKAEKNKIKKNEKKVQTRKNNTKAQKKDNKSRDLSQEPEITIRSKYLESHEQGLHNNIDKRRKRQIHKNQSSKRKELVEQEKDYFRSQQDLINESHNGKNIKKSKKSSRKKHKKLIKVIKWITLLGIIGAGIIYAMLSPMFNINNISVSGNSKISSDTIISLSGLGIEQNIFNFRTSNVINSVKENAYIDKVEVKRKLPDTVEINITEREKTFMLTFGNAYAYINNQGYILEVTKEKENYPIITGYETAKEQIVVGNRLLTNDLERLNDVLKIMEAASSAEDDLKNKITKIDIKDRTNYILTLNKEKKKIEFGDTSNLSTKILWIDEFLDSEKKNEGTIYLNVDLNNDKPYFREKV